ncbi:MAG TPA: ATP-binding protein [Thiotrichaceae bacterium]|nr:ATP-binding protein [Thiotrichaceae bacterium]
MFTKSHKIMLIEFSVSNFKSIKEEQSLSMETDSGTTHLENTFQPDDTRLLKTALIYGPNASGKTNVITAFHQFRHFILNSTDLKKDEPIDCYEPFKLDKSCRTQPTRFKITFLGQNNIKYDYEIAFNQKQVLSEILHSYPEGDEVNVFARTQQQVKLGEGFIDKTSVRTKVLENRLFLSEAANNIGDEQLGEIYSYFRKIEIWNLMNNVVIRALNQTISEICANDRHLSRKLSRLIRLCDTKIESVLVRERNPDEFQLPDDLPQNIRQGFITQHQYVVKTIHKVYENGQVIDTQSFDLNEESMGTQILYSLGGLILKQFETGGIVLFDEFNNSLHPKLCRFLISLFHNSKSNPQNAQLILATHETSLLDKYLFRKDQIWFTEKNGLGETELFSISDFEGIGDDINFQDWYLAGKFDAQPHIKEIEIIYGDE